MLRPRVFGSGRPRSLVPREAMRKMFILASGLIAALALSIAEASEPLNWVLLEATGSYITGAGGKGCKVIPDSFEIRADGTWHSSSEFNLTGSMDDDCGISITLTIPLDDELIGGGVGRGIGATLPSPEEEERITKLNETKTSVDMIFKELDEKFKELTTIEKENVVRIQTKKDKTKVESPQQLAADVEEERQILTETKSKLEKDFEDVTALKKKLEENLIELKGQMEKVKNSNNQEEIATLNLYLKEFLDKLHRMELYLKKLKERLKRLETRHELLDSRLMLFEKWAKLTQLKKTLAEDKEKLQASVAVHSRRKEDVNTKLEEARQKMRKERLEMEERLRAKRTEQRARRAEMDERPAKLRSRWAELRASETLRVVKKAKETAKVEGLRARVEKIKAERQKTEEEASETLDKIRYMYQMCVLLEEEIKIIFMSIINVGVEQAWICSIDPDLISGTA